MNRQILIFNKVKPKYTPISKIILQSKKKQSKKTSLLDHCDIKQLIKPKYTDYLSCNKPIINGKVFRKTKCEIVCLEGFDFIAGKQ